VSTAPFAGRADARGRVDDPPQQDPRRPGCPAAARLRLTVSALGDVLPLAEQHGADRCRTRGLSASPRPTPVRQARSSSKDIAVLQPVASRAIAVRLPTAPSRPRSARHGRRSRPSMRLLRMLVISSGLICMSFQAAPWGKLACAGCSSRLRIEGVEDRVTPPSSTISAEDCFGSDVAPAKA